MRFHDNSFVLCSRAGYLKLLRCDPESSQAARALVRVCVASPGAPPLTSVLVEGEHQNLLCRPDLHDAATVACRAKCSAKDVPGLHAQRRLMDQQ